MNADVINRADDDVCPLCGVVSDKILQNFTSTQAANHVGANRTDEERLMLENHIEKLWEKESCRFSSCSNCGLSFASPFVSGDSFFYTNIYDKTVEYPSWKWEFEITTNKLKAIVSEDERSNLTLLEIGAGSGKFVKMLSESGLGVLNILTTEYSKAGKAKIEGMGVRCLEKDLWELGNDVGEKDFDFICMFQVLEHMDDFDRVFSSLSELSNNDAHLFIAVPSNVHREFFEKLGCIEDVPPTHISRWSYDSFKYAGEKYGWDLLEHQVEPNRVHTNAAKLLSFKYRENPIIKWVNSIQNQLARKVVKLITYTPFVVFNIPKLLLMKNNDLGVVQWVMFKKK